ncbi:NAD(P)/FAD-dependent oxidoreductase [Deinococcus rubellus]|uniref:NAD(P)/FAD-dependent oxidoreductase n=1 Tax=Deinococcus rubellus TaxID=1889240 RepID=A0ABY5YDU5_9DEIO|nr:NAD(P)/FAD-dependent oxidoreductase [Deinococcus rubellus]UWX63242.1 NAD(P)/FAD-dependent oxidoreductase [Deinococcus rubellus]
MPESPAASPSSQATVWPAVIVGAGPAGLAAAACLKRRGVNALLLEREPNLAATWRRHSDTLQLHTDKAHSALPYLHFPATTGRYPSRDQVVVYLETYARRLRLSPQFGTEVRRVVREEGGVWRVQTNRGEYRARHLVLATGNAATPVMPEWPGLEQFVGTVMHSSRWRSGLAFRGAQVLVIGAGNSGHEIALALQRCGAKVTWSVRGPVNVIPRDPLGLPLLSVALALDWLPARLRDALTFPLRWWLCRDLPRHGLRLLPFGPFQQIEQTGRVPIIDTGIVCAVLSGAVRVVGDVAGFGARQVKLASGETLDIDAVILATGYRPAAPYTRALAATADVHACGYRVAATGMLHAIAGEARQIAALIARQERLTRLSPP